VEVLEVEILELVEVVLEDIEILILLKVQVVEVHLKVL
jgi:hypothetical protein